MGGSRVPLSLGQRNPAESPRYFNKGCEGVGGKGGDCVLKGGILLPDDIPDRPLISQLR